VVAILSAIADRVTEYPSVVSGAAPENVAESAAAYLSPAVVLSTTPSIMVRHQAEARATAAPSATAAPDATGGTAGATPEGQSPFSTYTVQPGDSVGSIAESFGLDSNYIMWNNPEVREDPDYLIVGANVLIPSVNGLVYTVTLGDTLSDIAAYYQIDVQTITSFAPNELTSPDDVIEGKVLVLPGAVPPPPPPPPEPEPEPEPAPIYAADPAPAYEPEPEPAPRYTSTGFIWPFYGNISQYFSGYHRGIDIDGFGAYGATISAAADGVVVLAAYQDWGYGYHVIVQHDDGSRTLYAHLSDIWVGQGQYVSQGEGVGSLGSTGYSTGPHLHFEVHVGGPVDPLAYLP
jgi:murein DD-endopeptidase MepM/ murein hydrolase activator NlpD